MITNTAKRAKWAAPQRCIALIVLGWALMAILHEINVGGEWDPVGMSTWAWMFSWVTALAIGYLIAIRGGPTTRTVREGIVPTYLNRSIVALCGVTAIGIGLFIFDFAILRGYGFSTAAAAIRSEEVNAAVTGFGRSSAFSGLGRLMIPAFLPATFLFVIFWSRLKAATRAIYFGTMFFTVIEQILFEGGRFFIAATAVSVIIAYLLFPSVGAPRRKIRERKIPYIRLAALGLVMLSFFSYVFIDRVIERGDYFATAYLQLASSFDVTPKYSQMQYFEGPLGGLWFSVCMLWLYATQGVNELDLLLQQPYLEHAYGLYQLPHIGQAVLLLTGRDIRYDVLANLPTYGSYATFYGHSYIDFGNFGSIVLAVVLGYFTGKSIKMFWEGQMRPMSAIAPVMFTLCIFSPVISLIPTIWPAIIWSIIVGSALRLQKAKQ